MYFDTAASQEYSSILGNAFESDPVIQQVAGSRQRGGWKSDPDSTKDRYVREVSLGRKNDNNVRRKNS